MLGNQLDIIPLIINMHHAKTLSWCQKSPLYYASESLVIHAENINIPLKPTVRSEFTSVNSLVKISTLIRGDFMVMH